MFFSRALHCTRVLSLASAVVALASLAQTMPHGDARQLVAKWTDTPPALDGRLDDACWLKAEVAAEFARVPGNEPAKYQTRVRVAYDAQFLYLAVEADDPHMDRATFAAPDPLGRDVDHIWDQDEMEFFLLPDEDHGVFHLAATANLARYDAVRPGDKSWDADWRLASHIGGDHYVLELAIPFSELTAWNRLGGTPEPGERWRVNFCRSKRHDGEWTYWSATGRSFHNRSQFGHLVFGPRPERLGAFGFKEPSPWHIGENRIALRPLLPLPDALRGTVTWRNGAVQGTTTVELPVGAAEEVVLLVPITTADHTEVEIKFWQGEQIVLNAGGKLDIEDHPGAVRELLARLEQEAAYAAPHTLPDILEEQAQTNLQAAIESVRNVARAMAATANPTSEQWSAWKEQVAELEAEGMAATRRMRAIAARRLWADPESGLPPFGVTVAPSMLKVRPYHPYAGSIRKDAALRAARREGESFQIVLLALDEAVKGVFCRLDGLRGPEGYRIGSEAMRWFIVDSVDIERQRRPGKSESGPFPDPLIPGEPHDIEAGRAQPFWIDVNVPADAPAGEYTGTVELVVPGVQTFVVPVVLHVHDFTLPERSHLLLDFWYGNGMVPWWGREPTPEEFGQHLEMLARYRLFGFHTPRIQNCPVDIWLEPDGNFSFDFSTMKSYLEQSFKHHPNTFNINWSCNPTGIMAARVPNAVNVHNRATGQVTRGRHGPDTLTQAQCDALFPRLLDEYIAFLKQQGWFEVALMAVLDEPAPMNFERFREFYGMLRQLQPGLTLYAAGVDAASHLASHVDIQVPIAYRYDHGAARAAAAAGKRSWWYVCYANPNGEQNFFIDQTPMANRILFWQSFKYDIEGLLYWGVCQWDGDKGVGEPSHKRWPATPYSPNLLGDGVLAYPGRSIGELWPSQRLAIIRDGIEDFEYLWELRQRLAAARLAGRDDEATQAAAWLVAVPDDLVSSPLTWQEDAELLAGYRDKIAQLIERLAP